RAEHAQAPLRRRSRVEDRQPRDPLALGRRAESLRRAEQDHQNYRGGQVKPPRILVPSTLAVALALVALQRQQGQDHSRGNEEKLWQHRNLGKAFYENPTTQQDAVAEFKAALDLAPNSARERLNYGLALLRAGKTPEGIVELEKAQKQD